jgi:hypothetical protein
LIDYTAFDAISSGFDSLVLIVRPEIRDELTAHIQEHWPAEIDYKLVDQIPVAGTAPAVISAAEVLDGPFGVANADDLYGPAALMTLRERLQAGADSDQRDADAPHVMVCFPLADTLLSPRPVTRGVCRVDQSGLLVDIEEQRVVALPDGADGYAGRPMDDPNGIGPSSPLSGQELVSMNLWGFHPRIFEHLDKALAAFDPPLAEEGASPEELLLPNVVREMVLAGTDRFVVHAATGRCSGITHPDDLDLVRRELAGRRPGDAPPEPILESPRVTDART